MQFTDLPEEIIIMIIRELDLQSLESMYKTCYKIRNIICMQGVIRQCNMSKNVMATANTLKTHFFKDISQHLHELNLCGVPDLNKTSIMPAMKRLKCLRTLDVSYTNLTLMDLLDMHQTCPTLKDISINFVFGKTNLVKIGTKTLLQFQLLFANFENVHFVGSLDNLTNSKLAFYILEKAKLNTLKYTNADWISVSISYEKIVCYKLPQFNQFNIYLLNWKQPNKYYGSIQLFPVLTMIEFKNFEFIKIVMLAENGYIVNASPRFKEFLKDNFDVDAEYSTDNNTTLKGNVVIMVWNRETTTFDGKFFCKLRNHLKIYLPFFCSAPFDTPAPKEFDCFYITPRVPNIVKNEDIHRYDPEIRKRRRTGAPNFVLNYDTTFKEKSKLQLRLNFIEQITGAITLTTNCDYLRKLTFLSLNGYVRYSSEFFNVLFRSCDNLITLNVQASSIWPCASSIARSIPLTHSLKNFRLVDKGIDFRTLFSSFSQCPTLENIHIHEDTYSESYDIADPSIILEKCKKLYSLYIEAPMTDTACRKKMQMLNKAKVRCNKHCLNVALHVRSLNYYNYRYNYDPFMEVFSLSPIKPI